MSSNQRRLVLDVLQLIPDECGRRYNALAALIPHLTSSRRDRAYDLVVSLGGGQASSALLRARLLAALSQRWDGEQRAQMLNQALETALSILDSKDRAHTLVRLCEHLKDELRDRFIREGLDAAGEIVDPKERVHALAAIAAHLSGNSFTQAVQEGLDAAGEIADPKERAHALAAIAAHLSGNSFTQAVQEGLDAAGMVRDPKEQAYVLQALTPYLDRSSISHALKIANVPAAAGWRAFALAAVARRLAGEQQAQVFHEALGAVEAEPDDRQRGWLLAGLAPECTDPALLDRAMHLARAIPSPWPRIEALAALAPRFTGEARQSVLDLARHAVLTLPSDDWQAKYQAYAVELLAPVAHDDTLEHLLEIAIGIMETPWRAYALDALCPRLTAGLVKRSLEALARPSEPELALALAALMPYMPCDEQLKALESLEFALASSHAARRDTTGLLTKLASLLSGEPRTQVLRKAFAEALLVSHRWHPEDEALKALLPQLSDELLISGLEEVLTQTDVSILVLLHKEGDGLVLAG